MHPDDVHLMTAKQAFLSPGGDRLCPDCNAAIVELGRKLDGSVGQLQMSSLTDLSKMSVTKLYPYLATCPNGHKVKWTAA